MPGGFTFLKCFCLIFTKDISFTQLKHVQMMKKRAAKMRINISSAIAKMIAIYEIHIITTDFS